ncbi:MAG: flagellar basal body rod protein FlgB [Halothiobacillaceae bacterium]|jgi:flagellar basal-body rod protein FlgB|nr:flagellar basal body rod protein FlgB [Halothiobacillaceae bacterium]
MSSISDRVFGLHDEALLLRSRRSQVLASNLANVDTPNYKARDFDFRAALAASQGSGGVGSLTRTHERHLPPVGMDALGARMQYRVPDQASLDGNTVDPDSEQVEFMQNAVRYQSTLSFLNSRIGSLTDALKGDKA